MEEKLSEIYNKIANQLNSVIPVDWDKVYLIGEVEKGQASYSSSFYYFESESGNIIRGQDLIKDFDDPLADSINALSDMVFEMNNCFKEEGQELWERVSFYLENSGKFNVEFFYKIMHKNDGGSLPREVVWAHKTFGFNPPEGGYLRQILDEYKDKN